MSIHKQLLWSILKNNLNNIKENFKKPSEQYSSPLLSV